MGLLETLASGLLDYSRSEPEGLLARGLRKPAGMLGRGVNNAINMQGPGLLAQQDAFFRPSVMNTPQDTRAQGAAYLQNVVTGPLGMSPMGWTAYHGSPHKFDKFSLNKIGTGEGAQAYGHGLYFADNPSVAKDYAINLAAKNGEVGPTLGGKPIYDAYKALENQANRLPHQQAQAYYNKMDIVERLGLNDWPDDVLKYAKESYGADSPEVAWLQKDILPKYKGPGHMYKVDISDTRAPKEAFLDWDKTLSQQSESVRKALEPLVAPIRKEMSKPAGKGWGDLAAPQVYDPTGQELLALLRRPTGGASDILANGLGPDVSAMLLKSGIPGIRYLDAGSRANGGTYNTVLFDDSLVTILGRE